MATVRFIDDHCAAEIAHGAEMSRLCRMFMEKLTRPLLEDEFVLVQWLYQSAFDNGVEAERESR